MTITYIVTSTRFNSSRKFNFDMFPIKTDFREIYRNVRAEQIATKTVLKFIKNNASTYIFLKINFVLKTLNPTLRPWPKYTL